ncbi:MAG: ATPase domain-containing protein [Candidatus Micrarchaeota archaeon]
MDNRVPTGIVGLDDLLEGGFPRKRLVLLSGSTGTCKSIFGMQFIVKGCMKYDEPGVFVTFDEQPEKLREDMLRFGWDLNSLEAANKMILIDASSARAGAPSEEENSLMPGQLDLDKVLVEIVGTAKRLKAKRLVIDSLASMGLQLDGDQDARRAVLKTSYMLARSGLTTLLITEVPSFSGAGAQMALSKYGVEEFVSDGVISLGKLSGRETLRSLTIHKMRGTQHELNPVILELEKNGLAVKKFKTL